ncbi:P1 family peptidase [Robiginitalea sp. M366]|uniref:DmpA family aminopeptidase n=1 Tax=Robiginitalea aestuariiviva TaxID=3036903 RepID=UPI00240E050F|nr:P1 family peptidase [Robiginitalea aestuariiviva]MDG1571406.1 P1 family peptidase [Robiginitalea aestuariiviva]
MAPSLHSQTRLRDYGIALGVLRPGTHNAITDVPGVTVGHTTRVEGDSIRTGVTAILPHSGNLFQEKVPAAIYLGNGFGKLAGYSQVEELGNLETPIVLTNTLGVATGVEALVSYTLTQPGNEEVRSVNAVVGETNDGYLNDIRGRHLTQADVLQAIAAAGPGPVAEGNVGAGTGTIAFGFKGGIGTASRVLPEKSNGYTVGVLVQANFGGVLTLNGKNLAAALNRIPRNYRYDTDGSCMMVVLTDAPLDARNLKRLAKRCMLGLARTGGIASNGSGDYVIAVSTAPQNRILYTPNGITATVETLHNDAMSPLFLAAIEATEEAIWNALTAAETLSGHRGTIEALDMSKVLQVLKE